MTVKTTLNGLFCVPLTRGLMTLLRSPDIRRSLFTALDCPLCRVTRPSQGTLDVIWRHAPPDQVRPYP